MGTERVSGETASDVQNPDGAVSLREWKIEISLHIFHSVEVAAVPGNADDLDPRIVGLGKREMMTDGVLAGPQLLRHCLVHNSNAKRCSLILERKPTAS